MVLLKLVANLLLTVGGKDQKHWQYAVLITVVNWKRPKLVLLRYDKHRCWNMSVFANITVEDSNLITGPSLDSRYWEDYGICFHREKKSNKYFWKSYIKDYKQFIYAFQPILFLSVSKFTSVGLEAVSQVILTFCKLLDSVPCTSVDYRLRILSQMSL